MIPVEQVNHYYPYGGLMGESTGGDIQKYKYNGKRLERNHGLDWYDYGARHYDAAIISWPTMDPLCEKYYSISPYVYCGCNPIKYIDLYGKIPTPYEAALMAKAVYGDNVTLVGGWERSGIKLYNREVGKGFRAVLYQRPLENGGYEYAYVTAGTELTDVDDWGEDVGQLWGAAIQYKESIKRARLLSSTLYNSELTFVGHSLGGGLATANALKTGNRNAITFNPAALSDKTIEELNLSMKGISASITNYVVEGEIVDYLQRPLGLRPIGTTHTLPASYFPFSNTINTLLRIRNHLIDTVIEKIYENF